MTNEEYARHIAEQWNVKERGAGYVTRFAVRKELIARYPEQPVGARLNTEYWNPAEESTILCAATPGLSPSWARAFPYRENAAGDLELTTWWVGKSSFDKGSAFNP